MSEYSEDALVEQVAIDVFKKDLHYEHLNCYEEEFPQTLGRETKSEVVLVNRLSKAIDKLNPGLSDETKKEVISSLLQDRSRLSFVRPIRKSTTSSKKVSRSRPRMQREITSIAP